MSRKESKRESIVNKLKRTPRSTDGDAPARRRFPARLAGVLLAVVAVVFLVYSMVSLIGIRSKLRDLRTDLTQLTTDIANQDRKNQEMEKIANQSGEELYAYMEQIAHDRLDLVHEGEKIFIVVAGD